HHPTPHITAFSLHDALPISHFHLCNISIVNVVIISKFIYDVIDVAKSFNIFYSRLNCLLIIQSTEVNVNLPSWVMVLKEDHWLRSEEHTSELQSRFDLVCRL